MSAVDVESVTAGTPVTDTDTRRVAGPLRTMVRTFAGDRLALVSAAVLLLLIVASVAAPLIAPYNPNEQNFDITFQGPSWSHWFGTDDLGRDLFSRMLYGGRLSLGAAFVAVSVGAVLGVLPGVLAGYRGGYVDLGLSRIADAIMCIPGLMLSISLIAALGPGLMQVAVAVGIAFAPRFFRVTRGAALGVSQETFVKALRSSGAKDSRILLRHVLPNALPVVVVQGSLMFGFGLLAEAGLSFLGFGAQPPSASWGALLKRGQGFMVDAKYLSMLPGLVITLAVLAGNLAGDGLQRALANQRSRGHE